MEYTPTTWVDQRTLIDAEKMNKIEQGLAAAAEAITRLENSGGGDYNELENVPIKYVTSSTDNMLALRNMESGTYVLSGKFLPFSGSTASISFASALLVNIITKTAGTHVQVFYPVNNCVQFLDIKDDSYERTNVYLNDLLESIGTMSGLSTTDKTSLVAAINEVFTMAQNSGSDIVVDATLSNAGQAADAAAVGAAIVEAGQIINNLKTLPSVTSEDNGKFLRVVDNDWAVVALQDVSEVGL